MMSTALDHEPHVDTPPGRNGRWRWVVAIVVIVAVLVAVGAYALLKPGGDAAVSPDKDPVLQGKDVARPAVSTKTAVFRGTEPDQVRQYSEWLGKPVDYIVDFSQRDTWDEIADPAYMLKTWEGTGYRPVYSVGMLPTSDESANIADGANGAYDEYFRELGQNLVAANQADAILRIGWEFNLDSSRWSTDNPQEFIAYWRRIATVLHAVPGQQFELDWNPNNGKNKYDAAQYYPGDDVVDYVGVDAYDVGYLSNTYPYPENCNQACRLDRQKAAWAKSVYGGSRGLQFWSRFAAHHGKPMSLPEWGLWTRDDGHGGGDNSYYLTKMHEFITDPANDVAYQSYFEFDGDDGTHRLMQDFPRPEKLSATCSPRNSRYG